jgi:hypothetical protein
MQRRHVATAEPKCWRGQGESDDLQTKDDRKKHPYNEAQDFLNDSEQHADAKTNPYPQALARRTCLTRGSTQGTTEDQDENAECSLVARDANPPKEYAKPGENNHG